MVFPLSIAGLFKKAWGESWLVGWHGDGNGDGNVNRDGDILIRAFEFSEVGR